MPLEPQPHVRVATAADAGAIGRVHVDTWRVAYRGHMPDSVLEDLDWKRRAAQWRSWLEAGEPVVFVLERGDGIAGFVSVGASRDGDAINRPIAEVSALYVHPDQWRRGFGRALLTSALAWARDDGFQALTLWVLDGNTRAVDFYVDAGFSPDGNSKVDRRLIGHELHEHRYCLEL